MTVVFALVLLVHGAIHLMGAAKAFGVAELPELTTPISSAFGLLWLLAAVLFVAAAVCLVVRPRLWWALGACAVMVSMIAISGSWKDAKYGALVNAIAAAGVVAGFLTFGPVSLLAAYESDVQRSLASAPPSRQLVTDADLTHLPAPVQRYLRVAGVVGKPRVSNFKVRIHGRIRSGPAAPWMPLRAEQHSFLHEPARLFYLTGSMRRVPVHGYHRYVGADANMTVKAAAAVPVVNLSGPQMHQGETVTVFNDMCLMAPATLIDPAITWEAVDERHARASYSNGGHTIRALLSFNDAGELTDFVSDDRYQASEDGKTLRQLRWSTPLGNYRQFQSARLASTGEGIWHDPAGKYAYIELEIDSIEYNVATRD